MFFFLKQNTEQILKLLQFMDTLLNIYILYQLKLTKRPIL